MGLMRNMLLAGVCASLAACSRSAETPGARAPAPPQSAPIAAAVVAPAADPAPSVATRTADPSFAGFLPSRNGFRFRNQFTGSPLPFSLGGLEKHINLPNHYGLCGGMSFAAADFYIAGVEPPDLTTPPEKGDALYDYLFSRQVESLGDGLAFVPRFAEWMAMPDGTVGGVGFATACGLQAILSELGHNRPALLGLVLTRAPGGKLWENHQVLGYGARTLADGTRVISIYDPNFPLNDDARLEIRPVTSGWLVLGPMLGGEGVFAVPCPGVEVVRRATGRRDMPVRGFFEMDYVPRIPPARLR